MAKTPKLHTGWLVATVGGERRVVDTLCGLGVSSHQEGIVHPSQVTCGSCRRSLHWPSTCSQWGPKK